MVISIPNLWPVRSGGDNLLLVTRVWSGSIFSGLNLEMEFLGQNPGLAASIDRLAFLPNVPAKDTNNDEKQIGSMWLVRKQK